MAIGSQKRETIDDLLKVDGKAELIGGRIVHGMPTGRQPNRDAGRIFRDLAEHTDATGRGEAYTGGMGFAVPELPSGRESFCPDASYCDGPLPADPMRFIEGPPTFAVEVRSEGDYGPRAEAAMAAKRADYFAAGTVVVWDVDPEAELVRSYRRESPGAPTVFARGQVADAEPAGRGWRVEVDRVFGPAAG
jgi:Uma2 family endonuclease